MNANLWDCKRTPTLEQQKMEAFRLWKIARGYKGDDDEFLFEFEAQYPTHMSGWMRLAAETWMLKQSIYDMRLLIVDHHSADVMKEISCWICNSRKWTKLLDNAEKLSR